MVIGKFRGINQADIIFICVPTPYDKDKGFDLSYIETAISNIQGDKIVVIKSTLLPGSTETLQKKYPQHKILNNPEFLLSRGVLLNRPSSYNQSLPGCKLPE